MIELQTAKSYIINFLNSLNDIQEVLENTYTSYAAKKEYLRDDVNAVKDYLEKWVDCIDVTATKQFISANDAINTLAMSNNQEKDDAEKEKQSVQSVLAKFDDYDIQALLEKADPFAEESLLITLEKLQDLSQGEKELLDVLNQYTVEDIKTLKNTSYPGDDLICLSKLINELLLKNTGK